MCPKSLKAADTLIPIPAQVKILLPKAALDMMSSLGKVCPCGDGEGAWWREVRKDSLFFQGIAIANCLFSMCPQPKL